MFVQYSRHLRVELLPVTPLGADEAVRDAMATGTFKNEGGPAVTDHNLDASWTHVETNALEDRLQVGAAR